jgi:hypothetical protein
MPTKPTKAQDRLAELQLAELQGRQAFIAGRASGVPKPYPKGSAYANPYPEGSDAHTAWDAGFRLAALKD